MRELKQIEQTAKVLDIEVRPFAVRRVEELATAVDNAASEGAQALFVIAGLIFSERSRQLGEIAIRNRLPIMLYRRELVEAGGLMSYGTDFADMYRRAGNYVGRILRGDKPRDLPVEQPTRLELVINLKTAIALGLTVPETLLATADEVVQ